MKIGFIGLGKMGGQMVTRLLEGGHQVVVMDHHQENIDAAVAKGATAATDHKQLAAALQEPVVVWLMIPSAAVDAELASLLPLLPKGSIVIDGGNSDFRQTRTHSKTCADSGVVLMDVGTSGGILGLEHGFSMMVGGDKQSFTVIEPLIKSLAQEQGYKYFGPSGAGHYVKMIHNAIEYGMMESYAEGYQLLKEGKDYPGLNLADAASVWQHGSIVASSLNELIQRVMTTNPNLDGIDGYVAESGEARWTLEIAHEQGFNVSAIQDSMNVRLASQKGDITFATKLLAAMRNAFGGHKLNK